jgi:DNA uptake protein ComE-like DNA-binding protein
LTVVLTSLLAMVGVLFLLTSRLNRSATKATHDIQRLELGVDQVLNRVKQQLILDVPGVAGQEYYDAPDGNDPWLASLEPVSDANGLYWPQISDLMTGTDPGLRRAVPLDDKGDPNLGTADYPLDAVIRERKPIYVDEATVLPTDRLLDQLADADGDGIADARWFVLDDSDPYQPVFAAVRVVDHGGMLNVNTAFTLDQRDPNFLPHVDGSHQGQIDLLLLVDPNSRRDSVGWTIVENAVSALWDARLTPEVRGWPSPAECYDWQRQVVWHYSSLYPLPYAPFESSDELRLRYRYLLNYNEVNTRIENLWSYVYEGGPQRPMTHKKYTQGASDYDIDRWQGRAGTRVIPGNFTDYDFRHISTTINGDRLLAPPRRVPTDPNRMVDINRQVERISQAWSAGGQQRSVVYDEELRDLAEAVFAGITVGVPEREALAGQLTANLVDFMDEESAGEVNTVTTWQGPSGTWYYGFERQPFIRRMKVRISASTPEEPNSNSYMVELHNPFEETLPLSRIALRLTPGDGTEPVVDFNLLRADNVNAWRSIPGHSSLYILNAQSAVDLLADDPNASDPNHIMYAPDFVLAEYDPVQGTDAPLLKYNHLSLVRQVLVEGRTVQLYLDHQANVPADFAFQQLGGQTYEWKRGKVSTWEFIEPQWRHKGPTGALAEVAPGRNRHYNLEDPNALLRVPAFAGHMTQRRLTRVGDILRLLTVGPGTDPNTTVGQRLMQSTDESEYRLDLRGTAGSAYSQLFQQLTVLDPNRFNPMLSENEMRVKGRININTAPWFVLSALPWITPDVAQEIVYDRRVRNVPFASIGDLMRVFKLSHLQRDGGITRQHHEISPEKGFYDYPDFTNDDAADDLEEAHLLFSAVSNLTTVRSDVFSAYVLVRLGKDGPQRRVYTLLDRSTVLHATDPVQVVIRQNVPDPH